MCPALRLCRACWSQDLSTETVSLLTTDSINVVHQGTECRTCCDGHILLLNKVMIRSNHFPTPVVLVLQLIHVLGQCREAPHEVVWGLLTEWPCLLGLIIDGIRSILIHVRASLHFCLHMLYVLYLCVCQGKQMYPWQRTGVLGNTSVVPNIPLGKE